MSIEFVSDRELSDEEFNLDNVCYECDQGSFVGNVKSEIVNHPITKEVGRQLLLDFGNDGTFFDLEDE
jgi:hypothetical protein